MALDRVYFTLWHICDIYQAEVIRSWCVIFYRNILFIKLYLIIAIVVIIMFYAFCLNRHISYVMDVATPTTDCLELVYDLLEPVITRKSSNASLRCLEVSSTSLLFDGCNLVWLTASYISKIFWSYFVRLTMRLIEVLLFTKKVMTNRPSILVNLLFWVVICLLSNRLTFFVWSNTTQFGHLIKIDY